MTEILQKNSLTEWEKTLEICEIVENAWEWDIDTDELEKILENAIAFS
jgi:hypothetical protein